MSNSVLHGRELLLVVSLLPYIWFGHDVLLRFDVCRHYSFWVKPIGVRHRQLAGRKTWAALDRWWKVPEIWLMVRLHTHIEPHAQPCIAFLFYNTIWDRHTESWSCTHSESHSIMANVAPHECLKGLMDWEHGAGARATNKAFTPLTSTRDRRLFVCVCVCVGTCARVCLPDGFLCLSICVCVSLRGMLRVWSVNVCWIKHRLRQSAGLGLNCNSSFISKCLTFCVLKSNCRMILFSAGSEQGQASLSNRNHLFSISDSILHILHQHVVPECAGYQTDLNDL